MGYSGTSRGIYRNEQRSVQEGGLVIVSKKEKKFLGTAIPKEPIRKIS